jgi:hypothetical protein
MFIISLFKGIMNDAGRRCHIASTCCAVIALQVVMGSVVLADTTWTGTADTDWNTAGNWNNGIPGTADTAELTDATQNYTINYDIQMAAAYFGQLILTNSDAYTTTLNVNAPGFISKGTVHPDQGSNSKVVVGTEGELEYTSLNNTALTVKGELTVDGGEALWGNANNTYLEGSSADITVNSGTFVTQASGGGNSYTKVLNIVGDANLNIYGGTVDLTCSAQLGYYNKGNGNMTMTNGVLNLAELRDTPFVVGLSNSKGLANISGGTVNNYGDLMVGSDFWNSDGGFIVLSGGIWNQLGDEVVIGYSRGASSSISITGGEFNTADNTLLGKASTTRDLAYGLLTIDGGIYNAIDSVNNDAVIDVRRGHLSLQSGILAVDQLVATNGANSDITFDSGIMSVQNTTTISNTLAFTVGNGVSSATLELVSGTHSYYDGLVINTNSKLAAGGTNVTGFATIDGSLNLEENSILDLDFSATTNDFLMVDGTVTLPTQATLVIHSLDGAKRSSIPVLQATSLVGDPSGWEKVTVGDSIYAITKFGNQLLLEQIPQGSVIVIK